MTSQSFSESEDILSRVFPNPAIPDTPLYARAIERELTDQIHQSGGTSMEPLQEQIRLRRQLFGSDYVREYMKPIVRQILKDHSIEAPDPKRARSKQSRRLL